MMKLSRGAWIAVAAVAAVPVTVAFAKQSDRGWHSMSPEARTRLDEGKIAMAKTALKLTAEQEKLWAPLEEQARSFMKARQDKMAERKKEREERRAEKKDGAEKKRPDMAERLAKMSQNMTERADRMKAFSTAFTPFYASLTEEQKEVLRPLVRQFGPGFGGPGHKGPRWAHGGGWGHDGKHGDRGWGGRHDRGGPGAADAGPDDDAGAAPAEPAPKN